MTASPFRPRRRWRSLLADTSGLAMIEFAYALPIVVALGLGGLETANMALAHLRVSQIAATVADNAARVPERIDEADINEVFSGARIVGEAIEFEENGRIILSALQHNGLDEEDEGQKITWQRCMGDLDTVDSAYGVEGDGEEDDSLQGMGPEDSEIAAAEGSAIMFVEVTYQYQPLIEDFLPDQTIRYETAFIVRERVEQDITNSTSLPLNSC